MSMLEKDLSGHLVDLRVIKVYVSRMLRISGCKTSTYFGAVLLMEPKPESLAMLTWGA